MSLSTVGAGGGLAAAGAGGAAAPLTVPSMPSMSAQQMALAQAARQAGAGPHGGTSTSSQGIPPNAAALAADLVDKQSGVKHVKQVAALPLVAVDWWSHSPPVMASLAPKLTAADAPATLDQLFTVMNQHMTPGVVGKAPSTTALRFVASGNVTAHKTLRKFLAETASYSDFQTQCLAAKDDESAIVVSHPQRWVGLQSFDQAPAHWKNEQGVVVDTSPDASTPAVPSSTTTSILAEEVLQGVGRAIAQEDSNVVIKIRLAQSKKALTCLPQEMVHLLAVQAQHFVAQARYKQQLEQAKQQTETGKTAKEVKLDDEETIHRYPISVAVPAVYCTDPAMEALQQALPLGSVLVPRSVAGLVGAVQPSANNILMEQLGLHWKQRQKEHRQAVVADASAVLRSNVMVVTLTCSMDAVEATAIVLTEPKSSPNEVPTCCPYGHVQVVSQTAKYFVPSEKDSKATVIPALEECLLELHEQVLAIAPDSFETDFLGLLTLGGTQEQEWGKLAWKRVQKKSAFAPDEKSESQEDTNAVDAVSTPPPTPVWPAAAKYFSSRIDAIAMGTATLGGLAHGRIWNMVHLPGQPKPTPQLALQVQHVAPVAVGFQTRYKKKAAAWSDVKVVFDFDRRVPAGPVPTEFTAAEAAAMQKAKGEQPDEAAITAMQGSSQIPQREAAALALQVQIVQKYTRDGDWHPVGPPFRPLVVDEDDKQVACENVTMELSLDSVGRITRSLIGAHESIREAVKSKWKSKLLSYLGVGLTIAYLGGLLVKSYNDERVFDRDTRRLLAYYKHVVPGSFADGDLHNAQYLVYKYRNKKEKLWKNLEKKYGHAVLEEHEWPEDEGDEGEQVDLDQEEETKETEGDGTEEEL